MNDENHPLIERPVMSDASERILNPRSKERENDPEYLKARVRLLETENWALREREKELNTQAQNMLDSHRRILASVDKIRKENTQLTSMLMQLVLRDFA